MDVSKKTYLFINNSINRSNANGEIRKFQKKCKSGRIVMPHDGDFTEETLRGRDFSLIICLLITVAIVLLTKYEMPVHHPNGSSDIINQNTIIFFMAAAAIPLLSKILEFRKCTLHHHWVVGK
jgi:hypothetical protein